MSIRRVRPGSRGSSGSSGRGGRARTAWLRGALRRPSRAVAVVATLAVMTVGVVSALVAADSLEGLFVADAHAQWLDVDIAVTAIENSVFEEGLARAVGVEAGATAARWAPRLLLPAVAERADRREPDALVLGVGAEEQSYRPLTPVAGASDPLRLGPDEVLLNERAAQRLGAGPGDPIELRIAVPQVFEDVPDNDTDLRRDPVSVPATLRVAGVVADEGLADLHRTPNILLRRDALQALTDLEGHVSVLHLAAAVPGEDGTDAVMRAISPLLRRTRLASSTPLEDALLIAEDEGGQFSGILFTLALLVVAAAVVAAIQMLTALAQDRSREIAVLRAVGTPAGSIVRLVTVESLVYAAVGGGVGMLLSLPVASAVAGALADHFAALSAGRGREQVPLEAVVDPATLITGALIVLCAAALAGRSAGRALAAVDVDVLLRGPLVNLPARALSPRRPLLLALVGALLLGMGLGGGEASDALRYLGLTLLGAAYWLQLRRTRPDRDRIDTIAAVAAVVWATLGAAALADFSQGYETGFGVLVVAAVVSIVGVTVLMVTRFRGVMRVLRSYVPRGRMQAALRTAGSYAEASAGRSGRLFATFAIVLFMAGALQVLGSATAIDVSRQSGGFDVIGQSVGPLDEPDAISADGLAAAVALQSTLIPEDRYGVARGDDDDAEILRVRYPVRLAGITGDLPTAQRFELAESLPEYATAEAALAAAFRDADKAVVDRYSLPPGSQVGDDVVLDLGGEPRTYELIAVLDSFLTGAVFVAESELQDIATSPGPTLLLARGEPGVDRARLAAALDESGRELGMTARPVDEVAEDVVAANRTFTDTFALILLLGLAVALIAVVALLGRGARERRPYLAVLRAMGFRRWTVAVAVAAEPAAVGAVGAVAGLCVGLVVLRLLFAAGFSDLAFVVDLGRTALVLASVIALLVVLSALTALPAVPRDPSEALREIG